MGRLIKNHLARLIVLAAALYQVAAAIQGFVWPKVFWDFLSKNLDRAVKPFPFLQILNLASGIAIICLELPLNTLAGTALHQSIRARLCALLLAVLAAAFLYQATDPAIYYMVGMSFYLWAYISDEKIARPGIQAEIMTPSV